MIMTISISDVVQTAARALALKQRRSGIREAIRWRICPLALAPGEHPSHICNQQKLYPSLLLRFGVLMLLDCLIWQP